MNLLTYKLRSGDHLPIDAYKMQMLLADKRKISVFYPFQELLRQAACSEFYTIAPRMIDRKIISKYKGNTNYQRRGTNKVIKNYPHKYTNLDKYYFLTTPNYSNQLTYFFFCRSLEFCITFKTI